MEATEYVEFLGSRLSDEVKARSAAKIRAKGYTFQRCRCSLLADDIESESLRF